MEWERKEMRFGQEISKQVSRLVSKSRVLYGGSRVAKRRNNAGWCSSCRKQVCYQSPLERIIIIIIITQFLTRHIAGACSDGVEIKTVSPSNCLGRMLTAE